jgi:hypothetical protein
VLKYQIHENPSSGRRVVAFGEMDRWTDMNLIAAFRNFANAPKNHSLTEVYFILKFFSFPDVKNSLDVRPNIFVTLCIY